MSCSSHTSFRGGAVYGSSDPLIRAAPAEDPTHCFINLFIGWLRVFLQKGDGSHDLARLAVSALRNLLLDPCALNWV
jgi:hypothetical protein